MFFQSAVYNVYNVYNDTMIFVKGPLPSSSQIVSMS